MKKLLILGLASFALIATNRVAPALAEDGSQFQNDRQEVVPLPPGCIQGDLTTGRCFQAAPGYVLDNYVPRRAGG